MAGELNKLKLGMGSAFVKCDLRQLPQTNDVWEADFLPLSPKGPTREWLGIVVSRESKMSLATYQFIAARSCGHRVPRHLFRYEIKHQYNRAENPPAMSTAAYDS